MHLLQEYRLYNNDRLCNKAWRRIIAWCHSRFSDWCCSWVGTRIDGMHEAATCLNICSLLEQLYPIFQRFDSISSFDALSTTSCYADMNRVCSIRWIFVRVRGGPGGSPHGPESKLGAMHVDNYVKRTAVSWFTKTMRSKEFTWKEVNERLQKEICCSHAYAESICGADEVNKAINRS